MSSITNYNNKGLTKTQRYVRDLIKMGYKNQEIAELMGVELCTIKTHIHRLYKKVGNLREQISSAKRD